MRNRRTRPFRSPLAPDNAIGWTHIWDHGAEQLPITESVAAALVQMGMVRYSQYRIYKPVFPWTLERIRDEVLSGGT